MCDPPVTYKFGGTNHLSRHWKLSIRNKICFVLVLGENEDGSMHGEVLFTKEQYINEFLSENFALQTQAERSFSTHDLHHQNTRSEQITQLIYAQGNFIKFALSEKVSDICVFQFECFESKENMFVHRFGQTSIYCIKFYCSLFNRALNLIQYNGERKCLFIVSTSYFLNYIGLIICTQGFILLINTHLCVLELLYL